ncbi:MAG: hypothetical protein DRR08_24180 [Candidatus Parabeggiatoa sp. nov. 2]|nr:MAG: hypothetical protein B6247_27485 [Beggiatoa sp. 4572_84]RKZ55501.1 MAG: hypothetical protein DRR08_24180 [Gammaproteobacteria bacterium]
MREINQKFNSGRADANNPNNQAFWQERGYKERPENWRELHRSMNRPTSSKNRSRKRDFNEDCFLSFDSFGLLPCDGFGRLSKDDY